MLIEIQDKLLEDSQQNISDQTQLPITVVPESSLAENSTLQTQATPSVVDVNLLISLNFFLDLFCLFTLYLQVPTTSSLTQGGLVTFLPDDVKAKMIEVLPLLNRDIGQLVQDAEPIRTIFKQIQGQLPRDLKAKMLQVTYIENRQLIVQEAQDRLEERRYQEQLTQDRENLDQSMADLDSRMNSYLPLALISSTVLII
jgi:hypothetical protein